MKFSLVSVLITALTVLNVQAQRITNNSYKRSVYFTGSIVREEHLIKVEVADEPSKPSQNIPADLAMELHQNWFPNYVFVVPAEQADSLASWDANLIANPAEQVTSTVPITEITSEVPSCQKYGYRCLSVVLPMGSQVNNEFLIAISVSFVNQLKPKPEIQSDISAPVRLNYHSDSLEPVSVYETVATQTVFAITKTSKSLKLRCPVGRKPEKATNVNLPMEMKGFICSGTTNGPVDFHFESRDALMLRIKNLHRKFTHLPWSGEVEVKESYELVHDGPKLPESPSFSRIDFSRILQKTQGNLHGLQLVPRLLVVIPRGAKSLQVRDEVGIVWTEMGRNEIDAETEVVQIAMRFPLIGGMSTAFDFYYTLPADKLISPFKASSSPFKKLIQMPMFRTALDLPVDNFKLSFVLPEDAADIEYEIASSKAVKVTQKRFRTYFTSTGEKEISFEFKTMTRDDLEKGIAILYNYPFWGAYRKPLVAFSSFIFLIIGALYLNQIDLSLRGRKKAKTSGKSSDDLNTAIKNLFSKRREILMNYEDLIVGNLNTRPTSEQIKNDLNMKSELENQLMTLQNAIFERIKNQNYPDPQRISMNSMALKRLYDEQNSICQKILFETCQSLARESSKDSISSSKSSRSFKDSGSSFANVKMSQSGSGDLLSATRPNKFIEELSQEALKIDSRVSEYESKFLIC